MKWSITKSVTQVRGDGKKVRLNVGSNSQKVKTLHFSLSEGQNYQFFHFQKVKTPHFLLSEDQNSPFCSLSEKVKTINFSLSEGKNSHFSLVKGQNSPFFTFRRPKLPFLFSDGFRLEIAVTSPSFATLFHSQKIKTPHF